MCVFSESKNDSKCRKEDYMFRSQNVWTLPKPFNSLRTANHEHNNRYLVKRNDMNITAFEIPPIN